MPGARRNKAKSSAADDDKLQIERGLRQLIRDRPVLDQCKAVGDREAIRGRAEMAVLDGNESFLLKLPQHFPLFGEEIVVINVLILLEMNSLLRP